MNTTLLYTRVLGKSDQSAPEPSYYKPYERRFLRTYKQFRPTIPHDLLICNCGVDSGADNVFDSVSTNQVYYNGPGWDIGAFQTVGQKIESDIVFCFASPAYFWRLNWIEPILAAAQRFGPGLYGPMSSNENSPHLRTIAIAFHPKIMRDFPMKVDTRQKTCLAESCQGGLTSWAIQAGFPVFLVTESGTFNPKNWREPCDVFRKGDQTNCLVWDRHADIYISSDYPTRKYLERMANGEQS